MVSALVNRMIDPDRGLTMVQRLIGEKYNLAPNLPGAPAGWTSTIATFPPPSSDGEGLDGRARAVLDAKEFASLLNTCGRDGRPELGMAICLGDRGEGSMEGCRRQEGHRQRLRNAVQLIRVDFVSHITTINGEGRELAAIQYFHAQDRVEDTILGTVVGILMGTPDDLTDRPLIGLTQSGDGACTIKVSGRGTRPLTAQGLDLSAAMHRAARAVGGMGGGHNFAAGTTTPEGKETEFLDAMDQIVMEQLSP